MTGINFQDMRVLILLLKIMFFLSHKHNVINHEWVCGMSYLGHIEEVCWGADELRAAVSWYQDNQYF